MEKELIQEPLFEEYKETPVIRKIPYEKLLEDYVYPSEIKDTLFIDPISPLPEGFPDINKHIKGLGNKIVGIEGSVNTFSILFEGGIAEYYKEYNSETRTYGEYQIGEMIIFGVTAEPGVRAMKTSKYDTHILFYKNDDDLKKSSKKNEYLEYPGKKHLQYRMENGDILRMYIFEPEYSDIKNTWRK